MRPWMLFAVPFLLFGVGSLSTLTNSQMQESRGIQKQAAAERAQARVEDRQAEANSRLAKQRYNSGNCLRATQSIQPGQKFATVPSGTYVCDESGWTGQIGNDGAVGKLAYTSDVNTIRSYLGW